MKTANVYFKQGLLCAALLCLALAAAAPGQVSGNTEYCEITLTGCPKDYDEKALVVPLEVVALSTKVRACGIQDSAKSKGAAPSVMFIIDHSTSMDQNGVDNDPNGNRYRVTKELIETIYKEYPEAEIGVVIFANGLVFEVGRDANLVKFEGTINPKAPPARANQAYMPLLPLNQDAKTGGTNPFTTSPNPKVIDVYRSMFNTVNAKAAINGGPVTQSGTDISIAFEAALEAFGKTTKAKENRYIIFLSDGEPGLRGGFGGVGIDSVGCPDDIGTPSQYNPRCALLNNFATAAGTANVPTTYTVFLQRLSPATPPLIVDMTLNVQNNGYSATNKSSNAWALQSNYNALLDTMMNNIITPMLSKSSGNAKTITISSAGVKDSTGKIDGGEFTFSRRLPVDTAEITPVIMNLRYDVEIDSSFTNPDGTTGSVVVETVKDSLFSYAFTIRRTSNASANWEANQGLSKNCARAPTLDLQYSGESVKEVKDNMSNLTIVFDNTNGLFAYDKVVVQVLNANGDVADLENFTLTKSGDKWTYQFPRAISETATPGDNKLQHAGLDSIILVFRNPDVPLDTIRLAVPFVSNWMAFYDGPGDPKNSKKLLDTISVKAGDTQNIYAKLFDGNNTWDEAMLAQGNVTWNDGGSKALTKDGTDEAHVKFYTETAGGVYTLTATYKNGALTITKQITIKVIPGDPKYLEIFTGDSAKINVGRITDTKYLENNKEYTFKRELERTTFYAVLRDAFGNYIGLADGTNWDNTDRTTLDTDPIGDQSRVLVTRTGPKSGEVYIIAEKNGIRDTVHVMVEGESAVAVGPNPFVPGESRVSDLFYKATDASKLIETYGPIVVGSSGKSNIDDVKGVLVVATAPRPVTPNGKVASNGNNYAKATAVIYDAVGHIVFRSTPTDIVIADDGSTFGFVWDGKNIAGRKVGPGSYLMRMVTTLSNGEKFSSQRMIGVTTVGRK